MDLALLVGAEHQRAVRSVQVQAHNTFSTSCGSVEVDANHYGVVADEMTARHVADFLDASACG